MTQCTLFTIITMHLVNSHVSWIGRSKELESTLIFNDNCEKAHLYPSCLKFVSRQIVFTNQRV